MFSGIVPVTKVLISSEIAEASVPRAAQDGQAGHARCLPEGQPVDLRPDNKGAAPAGRW